MGLIANIVLIVTDIGDFFRFCRQFFDSLPLSLKVFISFVFGSILVFGLMRMILKVGS